MVMLIISDIAHTFNNDFIKLHIRVRVHSYFYYRHVRDWEVASWFQRYFSSRELAPDVL